MGLMVSAGDLLTLYIGLEMNSLAAYVLAAMLRTDERSAEAGLKYFVLGSLASGILLFGISLTYGFTGTTSLPASTRRSPGDGPWRAVRAGVRAGGSGVQDQRRAVPYVDPRRV
jgi:NADH:ubiquinone oxidoreductase subunit 2 (subunit N)